MNYLYLISISPITEHNAGTGADGNLPPTHQNGVARGNHASADENRRAVFVAGDSRPHNVMEGQIHKLEQEAYTSVLRALKAQSDAITWVYIYAFVHIRNHFLVGTKMVFK